MTSRTEHPGSRLNRPRGVPTRSYSTLLRSPKSRGGVVCADCELVQLQGRWQRSLQAPPSAEEGLCPACQRLRTGTPAGTLVLPPDLLDASDEILHLIQHIASVEQAEHPLERLMAVERRADRLVVTTTGVHLARKIAHKLAKRFHRKPRFHYADSAGHVEVTWDDDPAGGAE